MRDRQISVCAGKLVAGGLWAAATVLLATATATGNPHLGQWGMATAGAATTAHVRSYFITQNRLISHAFRLGREAARRGAPDVTELRPSVR